MKQEIVNQRSDVMKSPVMENGFRNHYCPYYSECLDIAIVEKWDGWCCEECIFKDINAVDIMRKIERRELDELDQSYQLLIKGLISELKLYL